MNVVIYCADIGSIPNHRFAWGRVEVGAERVDESPGGTEIGDFVDAVAADVNAGHAVAIGFECPLFVPVPAKEVELGKARMGEGNRSWSAGAGSGALATGIVQVAWVLAELRERVDEALVYLDWDEFAAAGSGVYLWEAFVSGDAKAGTHADDATVAIDAFRAALGHPPLVTAVSAERQLSLLGAALLWSGWSDDLELLHTACLVVKPPAVIG